MGGGTARCTEELWEEWGGKQVVPGWCGPRSELLSGWVLFVVRTYSDPASRGGSVHQVKGRSVLN